MDNVICKGRFTTLLKLRSKNSLVKNVFINWKVYKGEINGGCKKKTLGNLDVSVNNSIYIYYVIFTS